MDIRVGINGFGRIGRMCLRVCLEKGINVKLINDPFLTTAHMLYLFKFDSTHGTYPLPLSVDGNKIVIQTERAEEIKIPTSQVRSPYDIQWNENEVTYVIEASGVFTTFENAGLHLDDEKTKKLRGAKKVIITAPAKRVPMLVYGVNHTTYNPNKDEIVSAGSCDINCTAPMVKIIHDKFKVLEGMITIIHAITAIQRTVDGPMEQCRTTLLWRDGRGALQNIIPTATGITKSLDKIFPELKDKISTIAFRVPISNVSLCDMTFRIDKSAKYDEVKNVIIEAANGDLRNVLGYTEDDCVSSDFNHSIYSCVFDAHASIIPQTSTFIKIVAWYDNEYGYANRVIDLLNYMYNVDRGIIPPGPEPEGAYGGA